MTSRDAQGCEAVRSAILATDWLLVYNYVYIALTVHASNAL